MLCAFMNHLDNDVYVAFYLVLEKSGIIFVVQLYPAGATTLSKMTSLIRLGSVLGSLGGDCKAGNAFACNGLPNASVWHTAPSSLSTLGVHVKRNSSRADQ